MANTKEILPLLCVLCLQCVFAIYEYEYVLKFNQTKKIEYVNVVLGSSVTLVCPNRQNYRVSWYKHLMADSAAFIDYKDGSCVLDNDNYPSISLGRHRCRGGYYCITFSSIQYTDSGAWWCIIGTIEQQSQRLHFTVIPGVATTPSTSSTTTSTQQVPVPSNPITTTRSTTDKATTKLITTSTKASFISSTTTKSPTKATTKLITTSTKASFISSTTTKSPTKVTTKFISTSTKASFISSTTTETPTTASFISSTSPERSTRVKTSATGNIQTSQPASTGSPDLTETGDGNQPADKSTNFMILAIVGASVGVVLLVLVAIVVTLCVRARKKSHMRTPRLSNGSVCAEEDEEDKLELVENPMYVSYDQEEQATPSPQTAPSVYDKVPNVYAKVQKIHTPPSGQSKQDNTTVTTGQNSSAEVTAIYSLAKDPDKLRDEQDG